MKIYTTIVLLLVAAISQEVYGLPAAGVGSTPNTAANAAATASTAARKAAASASSSSSAQNVQAEQVASSAAAKTKMSTVKKVGLAVGGGILLGSAMYGGSALYRHVKNKDSLSSDASGSDFSSAIYDKSNPGVSNSAPIGSSAPVVTGQQQAVTQGGSQPVPSGQFSSPSAGSAGSAGSSGNALMQQALNFANGSN